VERFLATERVHQQADQEAAVQYKAEEQAGEAVQEAIREVSRDWNGSGRGTPLASSLYSFAGSCQADKNVYAPVILADNSVQAGAICIVHAFWECPLPCASTCRARIGDFPKQGHIFKHVWKGLIAPHACNWL